MSGIKDDDDMHCVPSQYGVGGLQFALEIMPPDSSCPSPRDLRSQSCVSTNPPSPCTTSLDSSSCLSETSPTSSSSNRFFGANFTSPGPWSNRPRVASPMFNIRPPSHSSSAQSSSRSTFPVAAGPSSSVAAAGTRDAGGAAPVVASHFLDMRGFNDDRARSDAQHTNLASPVATHPGPHPSAPSTPSASTPSYSKIRGRQLLSRSGNRRARVRSLPPFQGGSRRASGRRVKGRQLYAEQRRRRNGKPRKRSGSLGQGDKRAPPIFAAPANSSERPPASPSPSAPPTVVSWLPQPSAFMTPQIKRKCAKPRAQRCASAGSTPVRKRCPSTPIRKRASPKVLVDRTLYSSNPSEQEVKREHSYEWLTQIGQGSFGVVWKCLHLASNRMVAIKKSKRPLFTEAEVKELVAELQLVRSLHQPTEHPHIVRHLGCWKEKGMSYIESELCEYGNLLTHVRARYTNQVVGDRLNEPVVWRIIKQISSALMRCHERGIIHMDIKPENIYVSSAEPLMLQLGDFGIAGYKSKGLERDGDNRYLAPEVLNSPPDFTADVFALGMTLYELILALELPSQGPDWQGLRSGQLNFSIALFPLSSTLQQVIRACADPDPAQRPSAMDLYRMANNHMVESPSSLELRPQPQSSDPPSPSPQSSRAGGSQRCASTPPIQRAIPSRPFRIDEFQQSSSGSATSDASMDGYNGNMDLNEVWGSSSSVRGHSLPTRWRGVPTVFRGPSHGTGIASPQLRFPLSAAGGGQSASVDRHTGDTNIQRHTPKSPSAASISVLDVAGTLGAVQNRERSSDHHAGKTGDSGIHFAHPATAGSFGGRNRLHRRAMSNPFLVNPVTPPAQDVTMSPTE